MEDFTTMFLWVQEAGQCVTFWELTGRAQCDDCKDHRVGSNLLSPFLVPLPKPCCDLPCPAPTHQTWCHSVCTVIFRSCCCIQGLDHGDRLCTTGGLIKVKKEVLLTLRGSCSGFQSLPFGSSSLRPRGQRMCPQQRTQEGHPCKVYNWHLTC